MSLTLSRPYGLDPSNLLQYAIMPVLAMLAVDTPTMRALVLGTAMQESRLTAMHQVSGPALGLWQMEPTTHDDIVTNYLAYQPNFRNPLSNRFPRWRGAALLIPDLAYGAAMCAVHYVRRIAGVPAVTTAKELAQLWKTHYNTPLGAGTVGQCTPCMADALLVVAAVK